jgi:DNA-binding XRE family transcriptional regulator
MTSIDFLNNYLKQHDIKKYELATAIGISRYTLIDWLRVPLTEERKDRISVALALIAKKRGELDEKSS